MQIQYEKEIIEMNDEWSFKDFTNTYAKNIPNGINIYASCFSQDNPDCVVFDESLKVKFYNCNLDNCIVPDGCEVINSSQKRFKVQNDGNDWLIDDNNNPIIPINYKIFSKLKLEIPKPEDIPVESTGEIINLLEVAKSKTI